MSVAGRRKLAQDVMRRAVLAGSMLVAVMAPSSPAWAGPPIATSYPGDHRSAVFSPTPGPDGTVWAIEKWRTKTTLSTLTTDGRPPTVVTSLDGTPCAADPPEIAGSADGTAWLACGKGIMRVGPGGSTQYFPVEEGATNPVIGHDGSVWFSSGKFSVGRLGPDGATRIWSVLPWGCPGLALTVDAQGRVWYASIENRYVGYFDPAGSDAGEVRVTRLLGYDTAGSSDGPSLYAITTAADGSVWVAGTTDLWQVTLSTTTWQGDPAARPTRVKLALNKGARSAVQIGELFATPDGMLWATGWGRWGAPSSPGGVVVRVHPDGRADILRLGTPSPLYSPKLAADGRVWGTLQSGCLELAYGFRYSRHSPSVVALMTLPDPSSGGSTRSDAAAAASLGCPSGTPRATPQRTVQQRGRLRLKFTGRTIANDPLSVTWRRTGVKAMTTRVRFAKDETFVGTTTAPSRPGRYRVTVHWNERVVVGRASVVVRRR